MHVDRHKCQRICSGVDINMFHVDIFVMCVDMCGNTRRHTCRHMSMFFLRIDKFHVMSQVLAIRGKLPGMFACDIRPSRRNSFEHMLHLDKELLRKLGILGRTLAPAFNLHATTKCHKMIAGVGLNGRKYRQGDRSRFSLHSPLELHLITTFITICRHIEIYVDITVGCRHNTNCVDIYDDMSTYRNICRHNCWMST
jgi:hypothetical protein